MQVLHAQPQAHALQFIPLWHQHEIWGDDIIWGGGEDKHIPEEEEVELQDLSTSH